SAHLLRSHLWLVHLPQVLGGLWSGCNITGVGHQHTQRPPTHHPPHTRAHTHARQHTPTHTHRTDPTPLLTLLHSAAGGPRGHVPLLLQVNQKHNVSARSSEISG